MVENFSERGWDKDISKRGNNQAISPKEFIFKYLHYLPFILLGAVIGGVVGYLKVRWSVRIYHASATMLVQDDATQSSGTKDPRFEALVMGDATSNLPNEIMVLK